MESWDILQARFRDFVLHGDLKFPVVVVWYDDAREEVLDDREEERDVVREELW